MYGSEVTIVLTILSHCFLVMLLYGSTKPCGLKVYESISSLSGFTLLSLTITTKFPEIRYLDILDKRTTFIGIG